MAGRRALIAGLGTTGVLVALAALLLAVVGALLAFRGWPGDRGVEGSDVVSIDGPRLLSAEPPSFAASVPREVRSALSAPRRRLSRGRAADRADRQEVAGVRADGGSGAAGEAATPGPSGAPGAAPPGSPGTPGSSQPGVSDQVAGTVEQITGAGGGVGETAAPAGPLLGDTGTAVTGTVRQLGAEAGAQVKRP